MTADASFRTSPDAFESNASNASNASLGARFGLSDSQYATLMSAIRQISDVQEAILFGSRALGTYRDGSDVDIALKGPGVTLDTILTIQRLLEDSSFLFHVDLVHYQTIANPNLRQHIDTVGIRLLG